MWWRIVRGNKAAQQLQSCEHPKTSRLLSYINGVKRKPYFGIFDEILFDVRQGKENFGQRSTIHQQHKIESKKETPFYRRIERI